ncbi:MAG TPA: HNH endonuclease, partial [Candidatus Polarisedimenticolia bacterium]|nr:HNH endonuclease [Candidatus Polarisedimenticolia bacterium]
VPGCTSRSALNEHHIVFRSQQGTDDDDNLVTLCVGHHQQGVHAGRLRCFGRAPGFLWWDLGIRPGGEPLVRYFAETIVTRRPNIPLPEIPLPEIPLPASAYGGAG